MLHEARAPRRSQPGSEAELPALQRRIRNAARRVRRIPGENQTAVRNRVRARVVLVQIGIEIHQRAVLLTQRTFQVIAEAEAQREIALQLITVLRERAHLIGPVIAVRRTVVESGTRRVLRARQELREIGERDGRRLRVAVDHVQLRVVPRGAEGQRMAAADPVRRGAQIPFILKHADIREIAARSEAQRLVQGIVDRAQRDLRERVDAPEIHTQIGGREGLLCVGIRAHADETQFVFPRQVRVQHRGVIDGRQFGTGIERLAETIDRRAAAVRVVVRRILEKILHAEALPVRPVVIHAAGCDRRLRSARAAGHGHVISQLFREHGVRDGGARNEVSAVDLRVHDLQRGRIDLARRHRDAEILLRHGRERRRAAVVGEVLRHRLRLRARQVIAHPQRLERREEEQLVFQDGSADGAARAVVVQRRHLLAGRHGSVGIPEKRRGIENIVLKILVDFAVKGVRSRLGDQRDVRARFRALGRVVHRRVDTHFLQRLLRRRRQRLADAVVNRRIRANLARHRAALAGVERKAAGIHLAAGFPVEQVIRIHAVDHEAVRRVPLSVGPDRLIAQAAVRPRAGQKVRVHARRKQRQLRETPGAERRLPDGALFQHVTIGRIRLIQQRRAGHFHRGADRAHFQSAVHRGGAFRLHQNLGMRLAVETFLAKRDRVSADRKVRNLIQAVVLRLRRHLQVRRLTPDGDRYVSNGSVARVGHVPQNRSEQSLRISGVMQRGEGQQSN